MRPLARAPPTLDAPTPPRGRCSTPPRLGARPGRTRSSAVDARARAAVASHRRSSRPSRCTVLADRLDAASCRGRSRRRFGRGRDRQPRSRRPATTRVARSAHTRPGATASLGAIRCADGPSRRRPSLNSAGAATSAADEHALAGSRPPVGRAARRVDLGDRLGDYRVAGRAAHRTATSIVTGLPLRRRRRDRAGSWRRS